MAIPNDVQPDSRLLFGVNDHERFRSLPWKAEGDCTKAYDHERFRSLPWKAEGDCTKAFVDPTPLAGIFSDPYKASDEPPVPSADQYATAAEAALFVERVNTLLRSGWCGCCSRGGMVTTYMCCIMTLFGAATMCCVCSGDRGVAKAVSDLVFEENDREWRESKEHVPLGLRYARANGPRVVYGD